jgi:hypothetical protein
VGRKSGNAPFCLDYGTIIPVRSKIDLRFKLKIGSYFDLAYRSKHGGADLEFPLLILVSFHNSSATDQIQRTGLAVSLQTRLKALGKELN